MFQCARPRIPFLPITSDWEWICEYSVTHVMHRVLSPVKRTTNIKGKYGGEIIDFSQILGLLFRGEKKGIEMIRF